MTKMEECDVSCMPIRSISGPTSADRQDEGELSWGKCKRHTHQKQSMLKLQGQ
jgi:hypothetical protein